MAFSSNLNDPVCATFSISGVSVSAETAGQAALRP
jgi:hypothetical protein